MEGSARKLFRFLVDQPDELIDLGRAALAVAAEEYTDLNPKSYLRKLDDIARGVGQHSGGTDPLSLLASLVDFLARIEGFKGNRTRYEDPRNSFLNEVLDRRTGIPLSLSLVYVLVGRRVGLSLHGVAFPGHFLARCDLDEGFVVLDAFEEGRQLSLRDCRRLLLSFQKELPFDPQLLEPAPNRLVLFRLLSNLKSVYMRGSDWPRALAALDRMLLLSPTHATALRDRGLLQFQLERFSASLRDLERYQELAPDEAISDNVTLTLCALARHRAMRMN